MKSGTIFDNFIITDDVKEAEDFGNETWGATKVRDAYTNRCTKARDCHIVHKAISKSIKI